MSEEKQFQGWDNLETNFTTVPNQFFDDVMPYASKAEIKIVLYIMRHTLGFSDGEKRMTLDDIQNGRKRRDGTRIDEGTRLSRKAIQMAITSATEKGWISYDEDASDPARVKRWYSLGYKKDTSGAQNLHPNDTQEGYKTYTPEAQNLHPRGVKNIPRTKKDTIDIHSSRENKDSTPSGVGDLQKPEPASEQQPEITQQPELDDEALRKSRNKAINEIIKIAVVDQGIVTRGSPYAQIGRREWAEALLDAGVTPDDVERFIAEKKQDDFWQGKTIGLKHIANNIRPWLETERRLGYNDPAYELWMPPEPEDKPEKCYAIMFEALVDQVAANKRVVLPEDYDPSGDLS